MPRGNIFFPSQPPAGLAQTLIPGAAGTIFDEICTICNFAEIFAGVSGCKQGCLNRPVVGTGYPVTVTTGRAGNTNANAYDRDRGYYIVFSSRSGVAGSGSSMIVWDPATQTVVRLVEFIGSTQNRGAGCIFHNSDWGVPNRVGYASKSRFDVYDLDLIGAGGGLGNNNGVEPSNFYEEYADFVVCTRGTTNAGYYCWPKNSLPANQFYNQVAPGGNYDAFMMHKGVPGEIFGVAVLQDTVSGKLAFGRFTPTAVVTGGSWGTIYDTSLDFADVTLGCMVWDSKRGHFWVVYEPVPQPANTMLLKVATDGQVIGSPIDLGADIATISSVESNKGMDYDPTVDQLAIHFGTGNNVKIYDIASDTLLDVAFSNGTDQIRYNGASCEMYDWNENSVSPSFAYRVEM